MKLIKEHGNYALRPSLNAEDMMAVQSSVKISMPGKTCGFFFEMESSKTSSRDPDEFESLLRRGHTRNEVVCPHDNHQLLLMSTSVILADFSLVQHHVSYQDAVHHSLKFTEFRSTDTSNFYKYA